MRIHFVLIAEGSSDDSLIPHLENLCIEAGADEVTGTAPDLRRLPGGGGRSVGEKVVAVLALEPGANLVVIHRDADSPDPEPRYSEIKRAVHDCSVSAEWVAVVPIQETEAWLLLDEAAIRQVVGRPRGRVDLKLPKPSAVEGLPDPKEKLRQCLLIASEAKGRRAERVKRDFPRYRRLLLQRLRVGGPLMRLSAWTRLRSDLQAAVSRIREE